MDTSHQVKQQGYSFTQEPSAIGARGKGKYRDPFNERCEVQDNTFF